MSQESIVRDYVLKMIASSMIFEEASKSYEYLDREDVKENNAYLREWLERHQDGLAEGRLTLLKYILDRKGVPFFRDLRASLESVAGGEQNIVDLDEAKATTPCRLGGLVEITKNFDEMFVFDSVQDAMNNIYSTRSKNKSTPTQRIVDLSNKIMSFATIMLGGNSRKGVDSALISDENMKRIEEGVKLENIYWPIKPLQDTLNGIYEKSLNFVAAPQGSYKTCFLVQMAARNIMGGMNTAYVSAEMDSDEMTQRIIHTIMCMHEEWGSLCGKDSDMYKGSLEASSCNSFLEIKRRVPNFYNRVVSDIRDPYSSGMGRFVVLDCTKTSTLEGVLTELEKMDKQLRDVSYDHMGFNIIYLDYLGILDVPNDIRKKNQDEQGEWRAGFAKKRIAMGFCGRGIPVVSAHQVNREGQKRVDKKDGGVLKSYDLSGSGWIERYADSLIMLKKLSDGYVQIHSAKSRRSADVKPFLCSFDPCARILVKMDTTNSDILLSQLGGIELESPN